jgi:hypothetical protein
VTPVFEAIGPCGPSSLDDGGAYGASFARNVHAHIRRGHGTAAQFLRLYRILKLHGRTLLHQRLDNHCPARAYFSPQCLRALTSAYLMAYAPAMLLVSWLIFITFITTTGLTVPLSSLVLCLGSISMTITPIVKANPKTSPNSPLADDIVAGNE